MSIKQHPRRNSITRVGAYHKAKGKLKENMQKTNFANFTSDYILENGIRNVLILQNYSMYDKLTKEYAPLYDGNLNLTLHRLYELCQQCKNTKFYVTIPKNSKAQHIELIENYLRKAQTPVHIDFTNVIFIEIEYAENAQANRTKFCSYLSIEKSLGHDIKPNYGLLISDFAIESKRDILPTIYTFNISKVAKLKREYIDDNFREQLRSACRLSTLKVFFLNESQYDYMSLEWLLIHGIEAQPETKLAVDTTFNKDFVKSQLFYFSMMHKKQYTDVYEALITDLEHHHKEPNTVTIFFPFRLSDKAYKFAEMLRSMINQVRENHFTSTTTVQKKFRIYVTNINNTRLTDFAEYEEIINSPIHRDRISIYELNRHTQRHEASLPMHLSKVVTAKHIYFSMLELMALNVSNINSLGQKCNTLIPIFEDVSLVRHQTILEMQAVCEFCNNNSLLMNFSSIEAFDEYLKEIYAQ